MAVSDRGDIVNVQLSFGIGQRFARPVQVTRAIVLAEQTGFAMVASLHNVYRQIVYVDGLAAGHLS